MSDNPEEVSAADWRDRMRKRSEERWDEIKRHEQEQVLQRRQGRLRGELTDSLREKLRNCNPKQLRNVVELCRRFIKDHRVAPSRRDCVQRFAQTVLLSVPVGSKRYQLEQRSCGKNCSKCPNHGPYLYAYYRDGAIIKPKWLGKPPYREKIPRRVRAALRDFADRKPTDAHDDG